MRFIFLQISFFSLLGCSTLFTYSEPKSAQERFAVFEKLKDWPIEKKLIVYWHDRMIPFVEAQTDSDCAFAIGVVHAHLRLGQMELFKRMSAGRLSETGGPFGTPDLDHLIRILNLQGSAELSLSRLSSKERQWLQRYVDGVNFFIEQMPELPVTFRFMNFKPEAWTLTDALRVGRLASADANWSSLFSFLALKDEKGWNEVWSQYINQGENSLPSFTQSDAIDFDQYLKTIGRSGSNSFVVSGKKTKAGSALIANDPHLGIFAPNLWLLMGYKSPSFHTIGYMLPSVPVVALGRNKEIAWGGTYMRGVSSHLFEVQDEDVVSEREERIGRRFWFDKKVKIRESSQGPILTDHPNFKNSKTQIALSWTGQLGSNEFGSYFKANQSKNFKEFRKSFEDYAVAGLNLTYADNLGNVALIPAIRQPILSDEKDQFELVKNRKTKITHNLPPSELPYALNPSQGFIVSTNNLPFKTAPRIAYVSGSNDRFNRASELLSNKQFLNTQDLMRTQSDVFSRESHEFSRFIAKRFESHLTSSIDDILKPLETWDGQYRIEQKEPLVFEFLTWQMANFYFSEKLKNKKLVKRVLESEDWRIIFGREFRELDESSQRDLVVKSAQLIKKPLEQFKNWGEYHVQVVQSPLGLIPYLGKRFRFQEYPAAGSSTTLNKSVFSPGFKKSQVTFGAQVRHISDLSSLDENYFVMLGGNDGWLSNPHLFDQVELWRKGEYLKLPLDLENVKKTFNKKIITLSPKS